MSQVLQALNTDIAREPDAREDAVVYFVRRPQYQFALTIVQSHSDRADGGQPVFQIRFLGSSACQETILGFADLQGFYESLCRMMDYVYIERGKSLKNC